MPNCVQGTLHPKSSHKHTQSDNTHIYPTQKCAMESLFLCQLTNEKFCHLINVKLVKKPDRKQKKEQRLVGAFFLYRLCRLAVSFSYLALKVRCLSVTGYTARGNRRPNPWEKCLIGVASQRICIVWFSTTVKEWAHHFGAKLFVYISKFYP